MDEPIRSHRDLRVWQRAIDLVERAYRLTNRFPKSEIYGLSSQLQRSAVSVPANIAEGHGRKSTGAYLHHLSIANGSLAEVETHVVIAERLGYVTREDIRDVSEPLEETRRMLAALIRSMEVRKASPKPQVPTLDPKP